MPPSRQSRSGGHTHPPIEQLLQVIPTVQMIVEPAAGERLRVSTPSGSPGPPGTPEPPWVDEDRLSEDGNGYPEPPIEIVLVDDVEGIRKLVRMALEDSEWFEVRGEAGNGREGIEVVGQHQPDMVLLDLSMPDMDGLEALPGILDASPHSKIAIYSGFKADRLEAEAIELGAIGYLEKGLDPGELVSELVGLLEPSR